MRVGEPEHPVGNAPPELARLGIDVARVQLRVIPGQTGKGDQVRVGDRSAGTAERHPDVEIGVGVAELAFVAHRSSRRGVASQTITTTYRRASTMRAAGSRCCNRTSDPGLQAAASPPRE